MARVLVVDDEESIRETLHAFLKRDGHEVHVAEDAEQALALLEDGGFDVVVTDIILSRVTGVDLLRKVRDVASHVQVVMMTGEPTVETASDSLRAGAFDYLVKPIEKNAIIRVVANAARVKALDDEKRRLEEENRHYQENLESLVQERTHELRESEKRFRLLFENVPLGYQSLDENGCFVEVSPAWLDLMGYSRDEVIGRSFGDFLTQEYLPDFESNFCVFKGAGQIDGVTFEMVRKDGSSIISQFHGKIGFDAEGNFKQTHCILQDITARRQAERELAASEERYRTIVEDQTEFIVRWLPDGTRTFVNDAYCRYFELTREECIGTSFLPLVAEEYREWVWQKIGSLTPESPAATGEHRVCRPDGTFGWQQWTDRALFDESGNMVELQSVGRDVTERRHAEEQLKTSFERFQLIMDAMDAVVYVSDLDTYEVLFVNAYGRRTFGDIVGKRCWDTLQANQTGPCSFCSNDRLLDEGGEPTGAYVWEIQNTTNHEWYECRDQAIPWTDGRLVRMEIATNITERKKAEEALQLDEARLEALLELSNMPQASVSEMADFVLEEAVKLTRSEIGFIGFMNEDGTVMDIHAWSKDAMKDCAVVDKPLHFPIDDAGIWADAVRERRPVITNDYSAPHPSKKGYPAGHVPLSRLLSIPVLDGDRVVAAAAVGSKQEAYDDSDVRQLRLLMEGMWTMVQRKRAEEQLTLFRRFAEASGQGLGWADLDGTIRYANRALCSILQEESAEDGIGSPVLRYYDDPTKRRLEQEILPTVLADGHWTGEVELRGIDGRVTPTIHSLFLLRDLDGEPRYFANVVTDIAERREAEAAIRESQERYRAFIANSSEAIWRVEFDNPIPIDLPIDEQVDLILERAYHAECNDAFAQMYGFSDAQEVVGSRVATFMPGSSRQNCEALRAVVRAGYRLQDYETSELDRHGQERVFLNNVTGFVENGLLVRAWGTHRDITERRRAEEELRRARAFTDNIIETANVIIVGLNTDGEITLINPAGERIIGYHREELHNRNWFELIVPRERYPHVWEEFSRLGDGGLPRTFENPILTKAGEERVIAWSNNKIMEEDRVIGSISFGVDITERRRAEGERNRLVAAVEQAAEAIIVSDDEGVVEYANPSFEAITGVPVQTIAGQPVNSLLDEAIATEMWNTITRGDAWMGSFARKREDGTDYQVEATMTPVRDATGEIVNCVGIVRDVTQERGLQQQLRRAQKMEALGTLAGGIAHDFNNILVPVVGYVELALDEVEEGSPVASDLKEVLEATDRAKDLVQQILTLSRQGEQEYRPADVSIVLKEAARLIRASLPTTIEIRRKVEAESTMILADPTQIHQVVLNLCTNAGHAMRETGGLLDLRLVECPAEEVTPLPQTTPSQWLKLTVKDTGHGMPSEVLERIFEPYFTTKEQGEGTGLGLAVVHGIIESHGGSITVESEADQGTTFRVFLPLVEEEAAPEAEDAVAPVTGQGTILLVDDEQAILDVGSRMLEGLGYAVVAVKSSADALRAFQRDPDHFDLIMTDMTMPHMTGADLARAAMRIRPDIPVVLCTGFSELIDEAKAKAMGIKEFLMKPLRRNDVGQAISRALSRQKE